MHGYRDGIFKLLRRPGIDSKESIPPAYEAWRAVRQPYSYFHHTVYLKITHYCIHCFCFTGRNPLLLATTTVPISPAASRLFCKCRRRRRRLTAHLAAPRRRNWRSRVRHISPRHRRKSALRHQVRTIR
jgi:hypothetical protein